MCGIISVFSFGLGVGDAILVNRVEIAREVLEIEDLGLGHAPQHGAGDSRLQAVAGDVVCQQPRTGVRHLPVLDEVQVFERRQRFHASRDARPPGEPRPRLRRQIALQIEAGARRVSSKRMCPYPVERLPDLVPGHPLAIGALADVEPASEGVRLAVLLGHSDSQQVTDRLHFDCNRRVGGTCGSLDLRLQPVMIPDADDVAVVGHAEQDHPAGGIRERTDLRAQVGWHGALELRGEAFAERLQSRQEIVTHVVPYVYLTATSERRPAFRPRQDSLTSTPAGASLIQHRRE